jgi:hypothetical protein
VRALWSSTPSMARKRASVVGRIRASDSSTAIGITMYGARPRLRASSLQPAHAHAHAQPHNRTTAQPHNRTTAQPHNRTTAQPHTVNDTRGVEWPCWRIAGEGGGGRNVPVEADEAAEELLDVLVHEAQLLLVGD